MILGCEDVIKYGRYDRGPSPNMTINNQYFRNSLSMLLLGEKGERERDDTLKYI